MRRKQVTVALDEWAYTGSPPGAFKPVPAYAWALNELFRHSDVFTMGGFTFAGSTLSASRTDAVLNPIGLMFALYQRTLRHASRSASPATRHNRSARGASAARSPNVNAGSPTYPLDVAAALSADGKTLTVSVVNPTDTSADSSSSTCAASRRGRRHGVADGAGQRHVRERRGREPQVRVDRAEAGAAEPLAIPAISSGSTHVPIRGAPPPRSVRMAAGPSRKY